MAYLHINKYTTSTVTSPCQGEALGPSTHARCQESRAIGEARRGVLAMTVGEGSTEYCQRGGGLQRRASGRVGEGLLERLSRASRRRGGDGLERCVVLVRVPCLPDREERGRGSAYKI